MQKIIKSIIVFLFIFVLLVFYNSLNRETNYSTDYLVGNKLTNINLKSFDDNKIYTSEDIQKSRYTLINFWASWCAPCRIEHPYLMQLSKEKNLKILGVNFKDKKINASKFLNELGNPYYYMAKDTTGKQSVNFGIYGIPESILIDNETIVLKKFVGPLNEQNLNDIKEIINSL
jgi:cytochrome c biogenesis protein CcmG/thiol:disulfide interchange protein DsbE|tara:strand:- start:111 stop:632 length:522 start_codon:yes stop_codon:yes gene_type:complete